MLDLKKFFARNARPATASEPDPDSNYHPHDISSEGLEVEYQKLIATQFRRWGISPACTTIEVRKLGKAPDGFDVFVGMVRLTRWEKMSGLRLLLGLPLLEAKVRKTMRATWLADFSHFGGLWLHSAEHTDCTQDLRDLIIDLAPLPAAPAGAGASQEASGWASSSLPPASHTGAGDPDAQVPVPGQGFTEKVA